jgi:hypothetical protein
MRRRLWLTVVSALLVGGVLSACGNDPHPSWAAAAEPTQAGSSGPTRLGGSVDEFPYTGDQVFDLFYMHGLYLARDERWDRISLNMVATQQARDAVLARYGYFHVSIAHDLEAIETLLSDATTGEPLQPGASGIYWYRDPGMPGIPASWWALTRYSNVIAAWMAGGAQRTDEHWDRMTAELERLPAP